VYRATGHHQYGKGEERQSAEKGARPEVQVPVPEANDVQASGDGPHQASGEESFWRRLSYRSNHAFMKRLA
jgi:hypothetical protein